MVDATDLIIITSLAQTVVITLTLFVFIFQFRSQEKALKESTYQNVMGRYTDYVRMLVERPELTRMVNDIGMPSQGAGESPEKLSQEDGVILAYLLLGYGILEEVYGLYSKRWIDEETWAQWSEFLKILARHPLFGRIQGGSRGTFDKRFEDYVSKLMQENKQATTRSSTP
ncbi:MAG: hypothetical protein OK474_08195 [Thaumarchaeota archaeon]|nr:hypothetical protein [Nitrososphaerota archaeon]